MVKQTIQSGAITVFLRGALSFGLFIGLIWALGQLPFLTADVSAFLDQYGVVVVLAILVEETISLAINTVGA